MFLKNWQNFDFLLLGALIILIIFSVAMIDSAIAGNIELIENGTTQRQVLFAVAGLVIIFGATWVDYHIWLTASRVLYFLTFALLIFLLFLGQTAFGANRWINLGFAVVQPSELAKISLILVLAIFFANRKEKVMSYQTIIFSAGIMLFLVAPIFIQPDLSTSMVLMVIWGTMLFAAGLTLQQLGVFSVLGILSPFLAWPFMQDYQKQRIIQFAFPDPNASFGEEYNIVQAKITMGAGGLLGKGYAQGTQTQLRFLKVRHSDFIFSAIGEEFGFIGTLIVMAFLLFILWRVLRAARLAHDKFGALICYGVAAVLFFQMVVNMGMNLTILPVTGLPLPFVSQGGSSLVALMLGIGLVESVVTRHKKLDF